MLTYIKVEEQERISFDQKRLRTNAGKKRKLHSEFGYFQVCSILIIINDLL